MNIFALIILLLVAAWFLLATVQIVNMLFAEDEKEITTLEQELRPHLTIVKEKKQ